jgi:hypothetical protein
VTFPGYPTSSFPGSAQWYSRRCANARPACQPLPHCPRIVLFFNTLWAYPCLRGCKSAEIWQRPVRRQVENQPDLAEIGGETRSAAHAVIIADHQAYGMVVALPKEEARLSLSVVAPLLLETFSISVPVAFLVLASVVVRPLFVSVCFFRFSNGMEDSAQILRPQLGYQSRSAKNHRADH